MGLDTGIAESIVGDDITNLVGAIGRPGSRWGWGGCYGACLIKTSFCDTVNWVAEIGIIKGDGASLAIVVGKTAIRPISHIARAV